MKKFIKTLYVIPLVILLITFLKVNGQESVSKEVNNVYVTQVKVDKIEYLQGDKISGNFTIKNNSGFDLLDLSFDKTLTSDYVGGLAENAYITIADETKIDLKNGEEKIIPFELDIPSNVAGEMGVQIRTFYNNALLSWKDAFFNVKGEKQVLSIIESSIVVNEDVFDLQVGPTISETDKAILNLKIENSLNKEITAKPILTIVNYSNGEIISSSELENITVTSKSQYDFSKELFIDVKKPGVYQSRVEFLNDKGENVITPVDFQYIIDGDYITVHEVLFENRSVVKDQNVDVEINFSGKPININNLEDFDVLQNVEMQVLLKDVQQNVIGETKENLEIIDGNIIRNVSVLANESTDYALIEINFSKNGNIIGQYSENLPDFYTTEKKDIDWLVFTLSSLLVLIMLITYKKVSENKIGEIVSNKIVVTLGVVSLVLAGVILFICVNRVTAQGGATVTDFSYTKILGTNLCSNNRGDRTNCLSGPPICARMRSSRGENGNYNCHNVRPSVVVNFPGTIQAGSNFTITGSLSFSACANSASEWKIYKKDDMTELAGGNFGGGGSHTWYNANKAYSFTLQAPNTAGRHEIPVRFVTCTYGAGHTKCGYEDGVIVIVVEQPEELIVSCSVNPNPADLNQEVVFRASATGGVGAYTYEWSGDVEGSGQEKTKSFDSYGSYTSTLFVTDESGNTDSVECTINVCEDGECDICQPGYDECNGYCIPKTEECEICDIGFDWCNNECIPTGDECNECPVGQEMCYEVCTDIGECNYNWDDNDDSGNTGDRRPDNTPIEIEPFLDSPRIIEKGRPCTLNWEYSGFPDTCTLVGENGETRTFGPPLNPDGEGTFTTRGLNTTTKYTLTCSNSWYSDSKTAQCTVSPTTNEF